MPQSPTKEVFRLINESRAACVRLSCCAYAHPGANGNPNKQEFYRLVEIIAKETQKKYELPGYISFGSLQSNQWRFGKWHKIPENERNAMTFFNLAEDELKNGTINPDERDHQERKARAQEHITHRCPPKRKKASTCSNSTTRKRSGTVTSMDAINSNRDYCMRLRDAAGKDMENRNAFIEAVHDILNEMKPPFVFANSVATRLWRRGEWKHYIFEAPRNPLELTEDQKAMWNGIDTAKAPRSLDDCADAMNYAAKAMPFKINSIPPMSSYDFVVKCKDGDTIGEFKTVHDDTIMDQRHIDFARKELHKASMRKAREHFNKIFMQEPMPGVSFNVHGSLTGRWSSRSEDSICMEQAQSRMHRQGCYAKGSVNHSLYPCQKSMMDMMLKFDAEKVEGRVVAAMPRHFGKSIAMGYAYGMGGAKLHEMFEDYFTSNPNPRPKEEYRMKITKQTLIDGRELSTLSDSDLIYHIRKAEDEIRGLEQLKTKSKHITKQIDELRANAGKVAGFLDDRA
jgi:hypothetical protein